MHRRALNRLLARYRERWPDEAGVVARFERFVAAHDDCLLRTCLVGHITASAWLLAPSGEAALLTHHRKLGRWLQLGGHVDGETEIERAALREAVEESGMTRLQLVPWSGSELVPLDLDVHPIPARADEPAHEHWDVRFLLRAGADQELVVSDESNQLGWFEPDELSRVTSEESVLRLARKTRRIGANGLQ